MSENKQTPRTPAPRYVRLLRRWVPDRPDDLADWVADADWARLNQEPLRARRLLYLTVIALLALLFWASVAEIQEVTRGEGRVIPSSQIQIVQAVDGGVVEEIMVRPGHTVQQGELLMRIDPTRFISNFQESESRRVYLQAKAARLRSLLNRSAFIVPEEVEELAPAIVANEKEAFLAARDEYRAQIAGARQEITQRDGEVAEARARRDQAKRTLALVQQELRVTRPLLDTGAVSEVELLRLEREESRLIGERDQAVAQILRAQSAGQQAERKIDEIQSNFNNELRGELAETLGELTTLQQSSRALADRVDKAVIRSPVRGTVKRLLVNSVGAVVQPGSELLEIVPLDDALILETRIKPKDIAFLRPQQPAVVKFTAYDFAIYGGLEATVEQIGADSEVDDDGNAHYIVRVRTKDVSLGEGLPIIPGMVAQVDVITGKKTLLTYFLKPVLRARANAFTER